MKIGAPIRSLMVFFWGHSTKTVWVVLLACLKNHEKGTSSKNDTPTCPCLEAVFGTLYVRRPPQPKIETISADRGCEDLPGHVGGLHGGAKAQRGARGGAREGATKPAERSQGESGPGGLLSSTFPGPGGYLVCFFLVLLLLAAAAQAGITPSARGSVAGKRAGAEAIVWVEGGQRRWRRNVCRELGGEGGHKSGPPAGPESRLATMGICIIYIYISNNGNPG